MGRYHSTRGRLGRLLVVVGFVAAAACGEDGIEPTHRGTYLGGEGGQELNIFTPCGDTARLMVAGDPRTVQRLQKTHASMTRSEFQPIYIEVRGRALPSSKGYDLIHTGVFHVDTVLTHSGRVPMTCAPKLRPADPGDIG